PPIACPEVGSGTQQPLRPERLRDLIPPEISDMPVQARLRPSRFAGWTILTLSAMTVLAVSAWCWACWHNRKSAAEGYITTGVRRADLFPTVIASGRIESAKRTVVDCDLESISVGVRGQRLGAGGASVLLSVIPEGTTVKRGDVLSGLDSFH